jgi:phage virion morphogenesis protein
MADDFDRFAPWVMDVASRFDDRSRAKINRRLGTILRNLNAKRMGQNVQPDGSAMEPRKKQDSHIKDKMRSSGRMFKRMKLAKNMQITSSPNHVEIRFNGKIARAAEVHHFGLRDRVGRFKGAPSVTYPSRQLLGFGPEDEVAIMDGILKALSAE